MKPVYYKKCVNCNKVLMSAKIKPGILVPVISKYPFCQPCMLRHADNPTFSKWIVNRLRGNKIIKIRN